MIRKSRGEVKLRAPLKPASAFPAVLRTPASGASGLTEPSHALSAIGLTLEEAESSIRFSFGRFNSHEDSEDAAMIIADSVGADEK